MAASPGRESARMPMTEGEGIPEASDANHREYLERLPGRAAECCPASAVVGPSELRRLHHAATLPARHPPVLGLWSALLERPPQHGLTPTGLDCPILQILSASSITPGYYWLSLRYCLILLSLQADRGMLWI